MHDVDGDNFIFFYDDDDGDDHAMQSNALVPS